MTTVNEIQTFQGGRPISSRFGVETNDFHKFVPKKYGSYYVVEILDGFNIENSFVFFKNPTLDKDGRIMTVTSLHPTFGNETDFAKTTTWTREFHKKYPNNKAIGVIKVIGYNQPGPKSKYKFPVMTWIAIDKEFQGKGLSKLMYSYVIGKYGGLWSDNTQSPGSRHAWASLAQDDFYVLAYNSEDDTFHNVAIRSQPEDKSGKREEVTVSSEEHEFPIYFQFTKNGGINFRSESDKQKFNKKYREYSPHKRAQTVSGNRLFACKKIPKAIQSRIIS